MAGVLIVVVGGGGRGVGIGVATGVLVSGDDRGDRGSVRGGGRSRVRSCDRGTGKA